MDSAPPRYSPSVDAVSVHRAGLVATGRCPACAERLSARALFGSAPCSHCGAQVREFGVDGTHAADRFERRANRTVIGVAIAAAVAQFIVGWVPLADVLVAVAIAAWLRLAIVGPGTAMMSPARRVVTRGTARLLVAGFLAVLLVFSELLTLLGPLGLPFKAAISVVQVFGGVFLVTRYTEAQLRREARGQPVEASEYGLLFGVLLLLMAAVIGLTFSALWVVQTLDTFLAGGL